VIGEDKSSPACILNYDNVLTFLYSWFQSVNTDYKHRDHWKFESISKGSEFNRNHWFWFTLISLIFHFSVTYGDVMILRYVDAHW